MPKRKRDSKKIEEENFLQSNIQRLQDEMKKEIEMYNKSKTEAKKHYTKIHQIWGGIDVLQSIQDNYEIFPKKS